jgi:hypothetical protein
VCALNGSAFIISLALARQGRADEAGLLAEGHDERYAWPRRTPAPPTPTSTSRFALEHLALRNIRRNRQLRWG